MSDDTPMTLAPVHYSSISEDDTDLSDELDEDFTSRRKRPRRRADSSLERMTSPIIYNYYRQDPPVTSDGRPMEIDLTDETPNFFNCHPDVQMEGCVAVGGEMSSIPNKLSRLTQTQYRPEEVNFRVSNNRTNGEEIGRQTIPEYRNVGGGCTQPPQQFINPMPPQQFIRPPPPQPQFLQPPPPPQQQEQQFLQPPPQQQQFLQPPPQQQQQFLQPSELFPLLSQPFPLLFQQPSQQILQTSHPFPQPIRHPSQPFPQPIRQLSQPFLHPLRPFLQPLPSFPHLLQHTSPHLHSLSHHFPHPSQQIPPPSQPFIHPLQPFPPPSHFPQFISPFPPLINRNFSNHTMFSQLLPQITSKTVSEMMPSITTRMTPRMTTRVTPRRYLNRHLMRTSHLRRRQLLHIPTRQPSDMSQSFPKLMSEIPSFFPEDVIVNNFIPHPSNILMSHVYGGRSGVRAALSATVLSDSNDPSPLPNECPPPQSCNFRYSPNYTPHYTPGYSGHSTPQSPLHFSDISSPENDEESYIPSYHRNDEQSYNPSQDSAIQPSDQLADGQNLTIDQTSINEGELMNRQEIDDELDEETISELPNGQLENKLSQMNPLHRKSGDVCSELENINNEIETIDVNSIVVHSVELLNQTYEDQSKNRHLFNNNIQEIQEILIEDDDEEEEDEIEHIDDPSHDIIDLTEDVVIDLSEEIEDISHQVQETTVDNEEVTVCLIEGNQSNDKEEDDIVEIREDVTTPETTMNDEIPLQSEFQEDDVDSDEDIDEFDRVCTVVDDVRYPAKEFRNIRYFSERFNLCGHEGSRLFRELSPNCPILKNWNDPMMKEREKYLKDKTLRTRRITSGSSDIFEDETLDVDDREQDMSPEERCFCRRASFGRMIRCENHTCLFGWFHYRCVGKISQKGNDEVWYCPLCRRDMNISNQPAPGIVNIRSIMKRGQVNTIIMGTKKVVGRVREAGYINHFLLRKVLQTRLLPTTSSQ
ncbi:hypothetical protein SNEBB_007854 [Seison nebaliae]|nr:hypothetical protein SNEBB_007854 [Seison nebaliae]